MTTTRQSALLNPLGLDFDRFLYAQVGDDQRGGLLSVISALARTGVDPWEEAASLARLPGDRAVKALCVLLAKLPAGSGTPVDPIPLATHLASLLPRRPAGPTPKATAAAAINSTASRAESRLTTLLYTGFILLLLGTQLLMQYRHAAANTPAARPAPQVTGAAPPR
jgi:hypothetical protein